MEHSQPATGAYYENQVLSINIESSHGFLKVHPKVRLRVRKLQQPWTLFCGMVAVILEGIQEATITFLKLFDRRWAYQLRSDNGLQPWTTHIEESYANFLQSGWVASFLDKLNHKKDEAFHSQELLSLYTAETATYEALQDYQGKILRLLAKVTLDLVPDTPVPSDMVGHMQVKGILLQHLPGFTLLALDQYVRRLAWRGVVDEAVRITRMLGDFNISNSDARPDNFIAIPMANGEYRVFIIDFDKEWSRAK